MNKDMNQEQMEIQNNMLIEANTDNIKSNINNKKNSGERKK